jgi:hypothetical protein
VTVNRRHFACPHSTQPIHAGIVVCAFDQDDAAVAPGSTMREG